MRTKAILLFALLLSTVGASAQQVALHINPANVASRPDSTVVEMTLNVGITDFDNKSYICLIPILTDNTHTVTLPAVRLNGSTAHMKYRRSQARTKSVDPNFYQVVVAKKGTQSITYTQAVPTEGWMRQASLSVRQEVYDGNGKLIKKVTTATTATAAAPVAKYRTQTPNAAPATTNVASNNLPTSAPVTVTTVRPEPTIVVYRGSYIIPDKDATDERNEREFHFTLDETRVIAQINPEILSLYELYNVAASYERTSEEFYYYIDLCVQIHPTSSTANLNAAAAAIERGRLQAADEFLHLAARTTVAYTNNRGAYELMCNNVYEGIRLLKEAEANGSPDATHNLKVFFHSKRTK